jgi:hypothetical protein
LLTSADEKLPFDKQPYSRLWSSRFYSLDIPRL